MKTEQIKGFLSSMMDVIGAKNIELYNKIIDSGEIPRFDGPREFFFAVLYPWDNFIEGFVKSEISPNPDVVFIYRNSEFIDRHFCSLFEKIEGSAYSADKSRTIVKSLLDFYLNGNRIEFNYEGECTYHLPKKIFKDHDSIVSFYQGLKGLMYGRSVSYLQSLKELL